MKDDIIVNIGSKRYRLSAVRLRELLILNKELITLKYEGFGSITMTGLKKEYIKELDKAL